MVFSTGVRPNWFKTSDLFWYEYKTPKETIGMSPIPAREPAPNFLTGTNCRWTYLHCQRSLWRSEPAFKDLKIKDDNTFTFYIQSTEMVDKKEDKKRVMKTKKETSKRKAAKNPSLFLFEYAWKPKPSPGWKMKKRKNLFPLGQHFSQQRICCLFPQFQSLLDGLGELLKKPAKTKKIPPLWNISWPRKEPAISHSGPDPRILCRFYRVEQTHRSARFDLSPDSNILPWSAWWDKSAGSFVV